MLLPSLLPLLLPDTVTVENDEIEGAVESVESTVNTELRTLSGTLGEVGREEIQGLWNCCGPKPGTGGDAWF